MNFCNPCHHSEPYIPTVSLNHSLETPLSGFQTKFLNITPGSPEQCIPPKPYASKGPPGDVVPDRQVGRFLVGGWTNPSEKYACQIRIMSLVQMGCKSRKIANPPPIWTCKFPYESKWTLKKMCNHLYTYFTFDIWWVDWNPAWRKESSVKNPMIFFTQLHELKLRFLHLKMDGWKTSD